VNRIAAQTVLRAVAGLILLVPLAGAAEGKRLRYVPPEGFSSHKWGELRLGFPRLPDEPIGVGAAYLLPQEKRQFAYCRPNQIPLPAQMNGPYESCSWQATLDTVRKEFSGGGFYVLSEYSIPEQGFRWGGEQDGVVIHPVVYQFCANWSQSRKKTEPPPNFDKINKLCGVRLQFQSESREELAKLPSDHQTVYGRMLDNLMEKFGPPAHFSRRGQVTIETEEGEFGNSSNERKFSIWRWCPATFGAFRMECKASVTLTIDPKTGVGTVLYSTPMLWQYAFARENNGFKNDWLFRVLHAPK
jgi:hypothetical protein